MTSTHDRRRMATNPKRGNNAGSISIDAAGDTATLRITLDDGRRPKRIVHRETGERSRMFRARAERELAAFADELANSAPAPTGETVAVWADEFLDIADNNPKFQPGTRAQLRRTVEFYVVPILGDRLIGELTPQDLVDHDRTLRDVGGKAGRPVGVSVRRQARQAITRVCELAERRGAIEANPGRSALLGDYPIAVEQYEHDQESVDRHLRALDDAEFDRFLDALDDAELAPKLDALIRLLAHHGLRRAEAMGITWQCVDLEARTILIERTLVENSTPGQSRQLLLTRTKNATSRRTITLSSETFEAMRQLQVAHREALLAGRAPTIVDRAGEEREPVFVDEAGRLLSTSALRSALNKLANVADVGELGKDRRGRPARTLSAHDLRHTFASRLIAAGIPVATVAKALGHKDPAVTLSTYAHGFASQVEAVTADLAERSAGRRTG